MKLPSATAMAIVNRFSWGPNVMRDGKLIGQQYVVAEAIDEALAVKDDEIARLRESRDRLRGAIMFAHAEGFEWPADPLAEFAEQPVQREVAE